MNSNGWSLEGVPRANLESRASFGLAAQQSLTFWGNYRGMAIVGSWRCSARACQMRVSSLAVLTVITVAGGAHAEETPPEGAGSGIVEASPPAVVPSVGANPTRAPAPAPAPAVKTRPAPRISRIEVQLDADRTDAGLYRIVGLDRGLDDNFNGSILGTRRRQRLCLSPCRVFVTPGDFVVGGPRLRESPTFSLTSKNRFVRVDAEVGTEGGAIGGIVLSAVGGFTLLISLPIVLAGAVLEARGDDGVGLLVGGGAASAVGAGLLIGGLSMVVGSKTTVALHSTPR